jgi:hypothetical protein
VQVPEFNPQYQSIYVNIFIGAALKGMKKKGYNEIRKYIIILTIPFVNIFTSIMENYS